MNLSYYLLTIFLFVQFSAGFSRNIEDTQEFKVYPNPARSFVHVSGDNVDDVSLYAITGDKVNGEWIKVRDAWQLDVHELANGVYFVKIRTTIGKEFTERLIIEGH